MDKIVCGRYFIGNVYLHSSLEIIPVIWETVKALYDQQKLSEIIHQSVASNDHLWGIRN